MDELPALIATLVRQLDVAHGTDVSEKEARLLAVVEALGAAARAWLAVRAHNPAQVTTANASVVIDDLMDVIVTAWLAAVSLGAHPAVVEQMCEIRVRRLVNAYAAEHRAAG